MTKRTSLGLAAMAAAFMATAALGQTAKAPAQKPSATPARVIEVARISLADGVVEVRHGNAAWSRGVEDEPLAMGDRVRTQKGAFARLEFPWTVVAMSDSTEVVLQDNRLLTLELESGRIDVDPEQALLRVVTPEATISGMGRTLVRREGTTTFVGSNNGGATVESPTSLVRLGVQKGTIVNKSAAPSEPEPLFEPPKIVSPGSDPRYVRPGEIVHLTWTGHTATYHLEVLPIDNDVPMMSLDLDTTKYDLKLNWLGTYRWRVSSRKGPIEGEPSGEGLICVVEK